MSLSRKWEAPLSGPGGAWDIKRRSSPWFRLQGLIGEGSESSLRSGRRGLKRKVQWWGAGVVLGVRTEDARMRHYVSVGHFGPRGKWQDRPRLPRGQGPFGPSHNPEG